MSNNELLKIILGTGSYANGYIRKLCPIRYKNRLKTLIYR